MYEPIIQAQLYEASKLKILSTAKAN